MDGEKEDRPGKKHQVSHTAKFHCICTKKKYYKNNKKKNW